MINNKELLLVHASMYGVRLGHTVNVMLTPQFYTLKKEAIPVKYAYQAKKIAPSLFDGLLEQGGEYDYFVYKEELNDDESYWVFIAYDIEKIAEFLESKGIDTEKVAKIFFAQQSLEHFSKGALGLGDNEALIVIDDTVSVVPKIALENEDIVPLRFTNDFTPESGSVKLKAKDTQASSLMTQAQALSLAAIFLLFAGMFAVEGSRYSGDVEAEKAEIESIYETHPYLQSSYTRQDAIDTYKSVDKQERRKRDAIKTASRMIFKDVDLKKLKVDEKSFFSEYKCASKSVSNQLKTLLKKEKNNFLTAKGDTTVTLEGKL